MERGRLRGKSGGEIGKGVKRGYRRDGGLWDSQKIEGEKSFSWEQT